MGFLGRFMEQKGFLPLLDALQRLRTARPFHLAAVGSGDYEREYRAEVERRGLSGSVTFLPFTPNVSPVLRQLDLLVMPSLWEACPLLPMEAMALGVPIIGSDIPDFRDMAQTEELAMLFYENGNTDSLAKVLADLLENPTLQREMAEQNFSVAVRMTMERVVGQYLQSFA